MNALSLDRREFARLCVLEISRAAKLSGSKSPDPETMQMLAEDMAASSALARVPCSRVRELFAHARAYHSETPVLKHLVKSWAAISPKADAPAPNDAPRLPAPPALAHSEAQMRKLAAIRSARAQGGILALMASFRIPDEDGGQCRHLEPEEWMLPLLELDPSLGEVEAMSRMCTKACIAWYKRNKNHPPCWGKWLEHYGVTYEGKVGWRDDG